MLFSFTKKIKQNKYFAFALILFFSTIGVNALIGNNKVLWIERYNIATYGGAAKQYSVKLSSPPSGNVDFNASVDTSSYFESPAVNVTNGAHTFTPANWNTPWVFTVGVDLNPGMPILSSYIMDVSLNGMYSSGPSTGSPYEDTSIPIGKVYLIAQDTSSVPLVPLGGVLDEGSVGTVLTGSFSYQPSCSSFTPIRVQHFALTGPQQVDPTSDHPMSGAVIDIDPLLATYNTTVAVMNDNLVEGLHIAEGHFTYTSCVSGNSIADIGTSFLITDNDTGVVSIAPDDATSTENGIPVDNASFRISLDKSNYSGEDLIINYTVSGTATNGTDYTTLSGSATISSGISSNSVDIPIVPTTDALVEGSETAIITITSLGGNAASLYSINVASSTAGVTILDNVDATSPTVTIGQAVGQADPTTISSINFTAIFNEAIQTVGAFAFTCADVSVVNGVCNSVVLVAGQTYTVNVTASGAGVVSATVPAGGVKDVAGNLNTVSTSVDNSVTYNIPGIAGVVLSSISSTATEGG